MTREITPEEIRQVEFRTTLRGFDRDQVQEVLALVAGRIDELESQTKDLQAKLANTPSQNLESKFETVGKEVSSILQAAREAAESMRERAGLEAARWRREATEEVETTSREAAADAEAMRRDAWVTGTELLEQAVANAEAMRAAAERDVLTVMGEAERDAHRLTSGARREAEDLMRNVSMEAEKSTADAVTRRDEIIDGANRQAAAAQERTRALENRREELLEELENVRATLTRMEGSLEERREALDLTRSHEPSSVRIIHPPEDAEKHWELGETVRVVPADDNKMPSPDPGMSEQVSDQVARIREREPHEREPDEREPDEREPERLEQPTSTDPEPDPEPAAVTAPESSPASEPEPNEDLDALFASLRGGDDTVEAPSAETETEDRDATPTEEADPDEEEAAVTDWIGVRDSRLLPITNRTLRGVKKAITEVQNVALDSLRTGDGWEPDEGVITESVHAELLAVWSESFAAGHAVAEEMEGTRLKRPRTPTSHDDREFASDLAKAVTAALDRAGEGPRERQSAASRVFRVWRSDEAERRIRDLALLAYETGIEKSRSVTTG